jgi:RNA polymerase sigma factor (TIGR02999 family)
LDQPEAGDVSRLLIQWREGDEAVLDRLMPLVYAELHAIAGRQLRREQAAATLQTTALIHEAYLRLVGADVHWEGRTHFLAIAARTMRRVLVDHARSKRRVKRGGGVAAVTLSGDIGVPSRDLTDILALDQALERLAATDERKARVVELYHFGGLNYEEVAEVMNLSVATVHRDLRFATAWLHDVLSAE